MSLVACRIVYVCHQYFSLYAERKSRLSRPVVGARSAGVLAGRLAHEKATCRHVGDGDAEGTAECRRPDHRREIAGVSVGRLQERPGGDDARELAGVPASGLVLVGDADAVAPLDECLQVRRQLVDRHTRHRIRLAAGTLL